MRKKVKQNFMNDFQLEFKKIDWPKKDLVIRSSIITLFMVLFFTLYIASSDFVLSKIIFGIRN